MAGASSRKRLTMINSTSSLRAQRHKLERKLENAQRVLDEMRKGSALHLEFTARGSRWVLSNGRQVADDTARFVIGSSSVVGVGDALFAGAASQTFRWWNAEDGAA
jgi:hypothetical protein